MIRAPYLFAGALAAGLAAATAVRFSLGAAVLARAVGVLVRPRVAARVRCSLLVGLVVGKRAARTRSTAACSPRSIGTAGRAVVTVAEPPRRGRFDVRVRAVVVRWRGARVHEPVLLELPGTRAPPQGARLRVLGTLRAPPDYERTWLRRHGVHVVLRASAWRVRPAARRRRRPAARAGSRAPRRPV